MTAQEARQKREAAAAMLVEAGQFEERASGALAGSPEQLRLRGRALQARGSAWVLEAEAMGARDA